MKKKESWITPSRVLVVFLGVAIGILAFQTFTQRQRMHSAQLQERHLTEVQNTAQTVDPCEDSQVMWNTDLWGDLVKAAQIGGQGPGLHTASAVECCRECQKTKGCNRWVWCQMPSQCQQQCWLKRVGDKKATNDALRVQGMSAMWHAGIVPKDFDVDIVELPPLNTSIDKVALNTAHGQIRILLKPDWHLPSVNYVRRLAQNPSLCGKDCVFYRAEPKFLIQGGLRGYIKPNNETKEGPRIMEKGDIGWAGGFSGPDFFIFLGKDPAVHFGHSHTVWGMVADPDSMAVLEKIVLLPASAKTPNGMHMLHQTVEFSIQAL